ncbi:MAG TPA: hypothetical protein VM285_07560, partial [Polyangia bacterium]|nr:hypothetical protein [Polyangia bacterium]
MERLVTLKIEQALVPLEHVRDVRSCTVSERSCVEVTFDAEPGEGPASVRSAIEKILPDLPPDASPPDLELLPDPSALAAVVDVYGEATSSLLRVVADDLRNALGDATDAFVRMTGGRHEIRIELDARTERLLGPLIEPVDPAAETHEDEVILQTQGRESILLEVFAPRRQDVPSVARKTQLAVDRLRDRIAGRNVKLHVVDCSSARRGFAVNVACLDMPARTVAEKIAGPLATALRSTKEVSHLHTRSSRSRLTVRVEVREDSDTAAVLRRIEGILERPRLSVSRAEPFPSVPVARIDLHGKTIDAMLPSALRLRQDLLQIPGVARVDAPALTPSRPVLQVHVIRETAAAYGLTEQTVKDFLHAAAMYGPVTPRQLDDLNMTLHDGRLVPLRELVEFEPGIERYRLNGRPTITLDAFAGGRTDGHAILQGVGDAVRAARQK